MNVQIGAVFFATRDPRALASFYSQAFDLGEPESGGDVLGFNVGGTYLAFEPRSTPARDADTTTVTVWFTVEDTPRAFSRLLKLGAKPSMSPTEDVSAGETLATCLDPDGNTFGLIGPATGQRNFNS